MWVQARNVLSENAMFVAGPDRKVQGPVQWRRIRGRGNADEPVGRTIFLGMALVVFCNVDEQRAPKME